MGTLTIRYVPNPADDVGKLWFDVRTERFQGSGFFWSDLSELPGIIERLGGYPLTEQSQWKWGYNSMDGSDAVLILAIGPVGNGGGLEASIEVADLHDTAQRVATKLRPQYADVDRLRTELNALLRQRAGEARLEDP